VSDGGRESAMITRKAS